MLPLSRSLSCSSSKYKIVRAIEISHDVVNLSNEEINKNATMKGINSYSIAVYYIKVFTN
jgi:hypothetical protein